jgi:hypothetical protein
VAKWLSGPIDLPARHMALVERPILATLCTQGRDHPMLAAVWYEWSQGGISCSIPPDGVLARNLKRNSWAAILVAGEDRPYYGIEYRGEATLSDNYLPTLTRLATRYLGSRASANYLVGHPPNLLLRLVSGRFRVWDDAA